jgi:hypothetical protein
MRDIWMRDIASPVGRDSQAADVDCLVEVADE